MFWSAAVLSVFLAVPAFCALKPPPRDVQGPLVNDLPAPYNVQATIANRAVALQWNWHPPEEQPLFTDFGYEILRQDGAHFVVSQTTYADLDLTYGHYVYKVRVRGGSKEHGHRINHVSSWSEPVEAEVKTVCVKPPLIELKVEPTQRVYHEVPSLRMHLTGRVMPIEGCTLKQTTYKIDAETGASHQSDLKVDAQGRFDDFADALGPEDEIPAGETTFTVTVSAENEAGPSTSNAYTISAQLQNKFAPQNNP